MAIRFYGEVCIIPYYAGFGMYVGMSSGVDYDWDNEKALSDYIKKNVEEEVYELGVDELPEGIHDIRGNIYNEPPRVFVRVYGKGDYDYFGIDYIEHEKDDYINSLLERLEYELDEGQIQRIREALKKWEDEDFIPGEELIVKTTENATQDKKVIYEVRMAMCKDTPGRHVCYI